MLFKRYRRLTKKAKQILVDNLSHNEQNMRYITIGDTCAQTRTLRPTIIRIKLWFFFVHTEVSSNELHADRACSTISIWYYSNNLSASLVCVEMKLIFVQYDIGQLHECTAQLQKIV